MDLDELDIFSQDLGEPSLTYWQPPTNPSPVANLSQSYEQLNPFKQLNSSNNQKSSRFEYPLTDVIHSFIQDQQVKLSMGAQRGHDGQRRRMPSHLMCNPEGLLSAISGASQQGDLMNDTTIHDEVTRAAKALFSKRNRTLLHWLNPDVSKNQLKIDVNESWDKLPAAEKVFYISQVLGKFAPHTTSLMVNPQLGGESLTLTTPSGNSINTEDKVNVSSDSGCSPSGVCRRKCRKNSKSSRKHEKQIKKRKGTNTSDDEVICDSGLVMGEETEEPQEHQKPKRKYTKRTSKQDVTTVEHGTIISKSMDYPVMKIKLKEIKKTAPDPNPQVKRKYTKRKLERKQYKKREPKTKENLKSSEETLIPGPALQELLNPEESMPCNINNQVPESLDDLNLFIELDDDVFTDAMETFQLLNENIDSFWDSIGDPESLFEEFNNS